VVTAGAPWDELDVAALDTPVVVVNHARLVANIAATADAVRAHGVSLRPHVKTHKSLDVARLQIEHGAQGLTVATVGEAELFAAGGFDDLFIAFPVRATGPKATRLRALAGACRLRVGVESVSSAKLLGEALRGTDASVVVEIDSGGSRTGTPTADGALLVADAARAAGLQVDGVFTHGGHSYAARGISQEVAEEEVRGLLGAAEALRSTGHEVTVISAGSTPTAVLAAHLPVTEVRPGTYVFQDRLQVELGSCRPDEVSLAVATTVVASHADRVVVDAGAKTLSKDVPGVLHGHGSILGRPHLTIERVYDHHGVVTGPADEMPGIGEVVWVVPNHVCPVVDLSPDVLVDLGGGRLESWPVHARGLSR